jgi:hypothetical protein
MAVPTHIAADATMNDQPGIAATVDLGAGHTVDATNGNQTENNGLLMLLVTASVADPTFHTVRPEGPDQVHPITSTTHPFMLGPFETDEFGPSVEWHGLATTTVHVLQLNIP